MEKPLHKVLWLWLPIAYIVVQAGIEIFAPADLLPALHSENGPLEVIQFFVPAYAFFLAVFILFKMDKSEVWFIIWVLIAALGTLYAAGEEVSWGQHIFEWGTPESWAEINDQGETNLHNTSSWFDQKPRLILLIGTIVGGIIFPALQKFRPGTLPEKFSIIYPPATLGITSAFALAIKMGDKISEAMIDQPLFHRGSEVEELYLFYFVFLYLIVLRRRIMQD